MASVGRGVAAGVVGGLVGSVALRLWIVAGRRLRGDYDGRAQPALDQSGPSHQVAELAFRGLSGRSLTAEERVVAGEVVHYGFGAVVGGIYGGLAAKQPWVRAGGGLLFGLGVFLAADESSMPALGLTTKPWEESAAAQLEKLGAHLVFGVASDAAMRAVWRDR